MKKYAFAGASGRAFMMYAKPILGYYKDYATIVGMYDINGLRARSIAAELSPEIPVFDDFDEMLRVAKPDVVIVTTVDAFHHEYIIRSLEAGCEVVTEKPMTIDADKCEAILQAEKKYGKKVTVTFNYRYIPYNTEIKRIIASGQLGDIYSVDFEWTLDRNMDYGAHGTSYFRRWNRYMAKSGGLLVHKSTHHFDMVNWWLGQDPEQVFAYGKLNVYGKNGPFRGKNCRTCPHAKECEFYVDITKDEYLSKHYIANEHVDGYLKDSCVFTEDIDIYDTMSVNVRYNKGTILNYSLIAHAAYEGWRISINGSKGRLEAEYPETGLPAKSDTFQLRFYDLEGRVHTTEMPKGSGGHGGGDNRLLDSIFIGNQADPLGHQAGTRDGAYSILIGASANVSIRENRPVDIKEKVTLL